MDKVILGLLLLQSRTIYQLRKRVGEGLDLMYSSSTGSIQAAIHKLLSCGYIECEERREAGRDKKYYHITPSGKQCFLDWVNAPIEAKALKNPELTKLYFLGFASPEKREAGIRAHLAQLEERHHALDALCQEGDAMVSETEAQTTEAEGADILRYQLAAARYGRDFMSFNIVWYQQLLKEIKDA